MQVRSAATNDCWAQQKGDIMKTANRLLVATMICFFCSFLSIAHAGFDWGEGTGECSGDGSFQQSILKNAVVEVGEIPSGKQDVYIELNSDEDVDIQLYDKNTGDPIVGWNIGAPIGDYPNDNLETDYAGVEIEYSGYNGDGSGLGHEYIRLTGTLNRTLVMKAFGYKGGYAKVIYSWKGTQGCTSGGVPAESGSGTFQQQIKYYNTVEVGDLISGLHNVYIELISDEDVDIQLYDGNTKIVCWPNGILSGSDYQSTNYGGMTIEWSGYNGDGTGLGHEYIRISGDVDRTLTMKAFGYHSGYATVNYSWGEQNQDTPSIFFETFDQPLENNWYISNYENHGGNGDTIFTQDNVNLYSGYVRLKLNSNQGSELVAKREDFHFGRYRFQMKVDDTSDLVNSGEGMVFGAFIYQKQNSENNEIDIEFVTTDKNGKIIEDATNLVNFATHTPTGDYKPTNGPSYLVPYGSLGTKCWYGFDWHPDRIDFLINDQVVRTIYGAKKVPQSPGRLIINTWSGNDHWGGSYPKNDNIYNRIYEVTYEPAFFNE